MTLGIPALLEYGLQYSLLLAAAAGAAAAAIEPCHAMP